MVVKPVIISRQKIRLTLLAVIIALVGGVISMVLTHQRIEGEEQIVDDIAVEADAALSDFTYTQTEDGAVRWDMKAAGASHVSDTDETYLVDIQVKFFADNPAQNILMTADEARANLTEEVIEARGDVVVTMQQGYRLNTPVLFYYGSASNGEHGVIQTSERVTFNSDNIVLRGRGMRYDMASGKLQLQSEVEADIQSAGGR